MIIVVVVIVVIIIISNCKVVWLNPFRVGILQIEYSNFSLSLTLICTSWLMIMILCGSMDGEQIKMTEDHRITSYSERLRIQSIGEPLKDGETRLCGNSKFSYHT